MATLPTYTIEVIRHDPEENKPEKWRFWKDAALILIIMAFGNVAVAADWQLVYGFVAGMTFCAVRLT